MKKEELFRIIGEVDERKVAAAGMAMNTKKKSCPVWIKWAAMAACLCLVVGLALNSINPHKGGAGTLRGDTEIYPTVMVNGQLYEWRKGEAMCNELPNDSTYYGEITHIDGESPTKDCEFVSIFLVSGQIYTVSENGDYVYLCLTTDWLNETVVVFDLVGDRAPTG